mgnify:CR=1 FL=1
MNFTQFLLILNARKWVSLSILLLTVAATTMISLWIPKQYKASTALIIDSKSKDPFTGQVLPSQMFPGYMATQISIIRSSNVAQKVVNELRLADSPGARTQFINATNNKGTIEYWLADLLLKKLEVEPSRETNVIAISFQGTDPQFAALVANAFAKAYIETNQELRLAPARQTAAWFDQQIVRLRANLDKAQQKLTDYQREKGIVESEERLDVETRRLGELAGQMVAAQSAAFEASSRARDSRAMPEVFNNPTVQSLKALVAQSEGKLADIAKRVGINHPEYQRVQAEIDSYKLKLATELGTASKGVGATATAAKQRFNELGSAFINQKQRLIGLKQQREEATLLARDLENAQRIYDAALQRYGQSRMEAQSTQTDIAVLNSAVAPIEASSPRVLLNILLSVILGTLLGIGIGFVIELLNRRVRSGQDIRIDLQIPVLAEVFKPGRRFSITRKLLNRAKPAALSL